MAIAGLGTYQSSSMYYTSNCNVENLNPNGKFFNQKMSFLMKNGDVVQNDDGSSVNKDNERDSEMAFGSLTRIPVMPKAYGEMASYTRCISASINTKEMQATKNEAGEVMYSYKETSLSFDIVINSDGTDKTYTIKGIDENGDEFEREFDPYNLDKEEMDYPEFSALCMYIRQTDETADLIASSYFTDTSFFDGIFDRGDRVGLLEQYADIYGDTMPKLAGLAQKLFESINSFFENAMKENEEDLDIPNTVVTRHNEYTDPDTGKKVPVDVQYITLYTDEGISCKKISNVNGETKERDLWEMSYDSPESREKIRKFLNSFDKDEKLTFASQESFWKDFMKEDFDTEGFREYYDTLVDGHIDIEKLKAEGKTLRDAFNEPYHDYINNTHFIGKVMTEKELRDEWNAKIEANQKALKNSRIGNNTNATSRSTSSDNGKNIGVMTIGNQGYIAKYADSSTDADPVIKIGDYEVHVNKVDPKNATEIEMFALTSYMDDKGLTDNTGMKSFNKMRAYSKQAEYNGFIDGIADSDNAWSMSRNWISILENAKDSYFRMPETYNQGLSAERLIGRLMKQYNSLL